MKTNINTLEFNDPDLQKIYDDHVDTVHFDLKYLDQVNSDIKSLEIFLAKTLNVNESIFPVRDPIGDFVLWWDVKEKRIFCSSPNYFEGDRRLLETSKEVRCHVAEYLVRFIKFCLGVK